MVIVDMEIEAEAIAVELHRTIQVRNDQHNGHQTIGVVDHKVMMPARLPTRTIPGDKIANTPVLAKSPEEFTAQRRTRSCMPLLVKGRIVSLCDQSAGREALHALLIASMRAQIATSSRSGGRCKRSSRIFHFESPGI